MAAHTRASHLATAFFVLVVALAVTACGRSEKPAETKAPQETTADDGAPVVAEEGTVPTQSPPPAIPESGQVIDANQNPGVADIGSVTISVEAGANGGKPIPLDLVFVYDDALAADIGSKSAAAWFRTKESLLENGDGLVSVLSWQVSPGQEVPETPIDAPPGAVAAFLFANYATPGDHRQTIEGTGALAVTLSASDVSIEIGQ